jgi:rhamnose utilization protein RhaD (predicted bifunctional aldolase and dehydrogenase)
LSTGIIDELLALSHELGAPRHGWAILGEGNTSARIDDERFLVKASGSSLGTLSTEQLLEVRFAPLLESFAGAGKNLSDAETRVLLIASRRPAGAATAEPERAGKMPSVETLFHALLLQLPAVSFVGHTHVTSINGLLCSDNGWNLICCGGRLFPDEVVVCGVAPCCVPYADPGLPLASAIGESVSRFRDRHGIVPKTIYLQSHGLIALGGSAKEVIAITRMADKAATIMLGAIQAGGPRFLSDSDIARIATRPDEHHRQRELGLGPSAP